MTNQPVRRPVDFFAFAVCVGLCFVWGLQQVAIKAAGDAVSPMLQVGLRSAVSGLLLWLFNRYWLKEVWNPEVKLRDALLVGLCFTGEFFFVSEGLRFTSAAHMSVLLYTAPLFSAVGLAVKLPEERLNVIQWTGLLLAFCGILVAFLLPALTEATPEENLWILGDALGLGAGISWGFATIFLRTTTMNAAPASQMLFWQLATGAVILTAIALLTGQSHFESTTLGWTSLLFQTFIVSFASYLVWNWLLRRYLASRLGVFRLSLHDADLRRGPERAPSRRIRGPSLRRGVGPRPPRPSSCAALEPSPLKTNRGVRTNGKRPFSAREIGRFCVYGPSDRSAPAGLGEVVALSRVDPAGALGRFLLLPEGSFGLQPIHDEGGGFEGRVTVTRRHRDQDDLLAHDHAAYAVDHRDVAQGPAAAGRLDDLREALLGHPRIVFERHGRDVRAVVDVSHDPRERDNRAHVGRTLADAGGFLADVKGLGRDPNLRFRHGQPPVTGGKKATTSPSFNASSSDASSSFRAARMRLRFAKAVA